MKIALDAAGGDYGLNPNIEGALHAAKERGVELILVGPAAEIRSQLDSRGVAPGDKRFEIVDAPDAIAMDEDPAAACRAKPRASIMVCAALVAEGKASAVVSAGNSGATMVAALWHLKRLEGILRPAIASPIPTMRGASILLDAGANAECKPWHLLQFAIMGSIYSRHLFKLQQPSVGVLSVGEEDCKGNDLVKETIPLLRSSGLNFHGPIEGRDIPAGTADVIVCDGFVGNISVKLLEGTGAAIFALLKAELSGNFAYKLAGMALKGAFSRLKRKMSYDEYGGAPLLGVNGTVVICHGKSNAKAIANALRVASELVATGVNEKIRHYLEQMKLNLETAKVAL